MGQHYQPRFQVGARTRINADHSGVFAIRPIETADNPAVAAIIRDVMTEFGAVGCTYSISDPEVHAMCEAYPAPGTRRRVFHS